MVSDEWRQKLPACIAQKDIGSTENPEAERTEVTENTRAKKLVEAFA